MKQGVQQVDCDGVAVNVRFAGEGKPVVLLHGFPNSSSLWRLMTPHLVRAGYRVVAPDLRGFGASDAPVGKRNYRLSRIARDVLLVMDALGISEPAELVGHDWGAVVGWLLAGTRPERFERYVAVSVGHPYAYRRGGLAQLLKAWYVLLFLCPGVAERAIMARDWAMFRRFLHHADVEEWISDLARPGRLTAALEWYRANAVNPGEIPKAQIPVLGVWSSRDVALSERQMTGSSRFVERGFRYERFDDIGHWIPLDAPERLSALVLDFCAGKAQ